METAASRQEAAKKYSDEPAVRAEWARYKRPPSRISHIEIRDGLSPSDSVALSRILRERAKHVVQEARRLREEARSRLRRTPVAP